MSDTNKQIISFIGLPASGKGTQAGLLAEKLKVNRVVGLGSLVRDFIRLGHDDPFAQEIKKRYDQGIPQTDDVANDLIGKYLSIADEKIILDNYPFTKTQAAFLSKYVADKHWDKPILIHIKTSPEVVIRRATRRKVCTNCGTLYGATDEMICAKCGSSLVVRSDDNEETVRTRINLYMPKINEVISFYRANGWQAIEINGEQTIESVFNEIQNKL